MSNVDPTVWPKVSVPIKPEKVKVVVAVVVPSYTLLAAEAVAVKAFTATSAVTVESVSYTHLTLPTKQMV